MRSNRRRALRLLAEMRRGAHPNGLIELELKGDIGGAISASRVVGALRARPKANVHLRIDSEGGTVSEARAIYDALRAHRGHVSAHVGAVCASAATLLLLGADRRTATSTSVFQLHPVAQPPPASGRWTAAKHRARAHELAKLDAEFAEIVCRRTGQRDEWVRAEMATEFLMDPHEALRRNFVHEIKDAAAQPRSAGRVGGVRSLAFGVAPGHTIDVFLRGTFGTPRTVRADHPLLRSLCDGSA